MATVLGFEPKVFGARIQRVTKLHHTVSLYQECPVKALGANVRGDRRHLVSTYRPIIFKALEARTDGDVRIY